MIELLNRYTGFTTDLIGNSETARQRIVHDACARIRCRGWLSRLAKSYPQNLWINRLDGRWVRHISPRLLLCSKRRRPKAPSCTKKTSLDCSPATCHYQAPMSPSPISTPLILATLLLGASGSGGGGGVSSLSSSTKSPSSLRCDAVQRSRNASYALMPSAS